MLHKVPFGTLYSALRKTHNDVRYMATMAVIVNNQHFYCCDERSKTCETPHLVYMNICIYMYMPACVTDAQTVTRDFVADTTVRKGG